MEWQWILVIIMGGLLAALMSGIPVFAAFLLIDFIGIFFFMGGIDGLTSIIRSSLDSIGVFTLTPVPLFVIMGEVIFVSGMAAKAIDVVERILVRLPGRLSMVAVGAGAMFDAMSGSALGTCAMFGSLLVPEMMKRNYSKYMSMGPVMAASMLAVVIPPSTLAIIVAAEAGLPAGKLLLAGFVPGLMIAGLFGAFITIACLINPSLAPTGESVRKATSSLGMDFLKYLLPLSLVTLTVLGSIFTGIATPTEAAALGAFSSMVVAFGYGRLTKEVIIVSARRCLGITTMIFMILAGSMAFSQLLAFTGITRGVIEVATTLKVHPMLIIASMLSILLLLGCMIDQISMIMIGVPLFVPVAAALGYDLIWFALLLLLAITLGVLTPPFGLLLFIMKGVNPGKIQMSDVFLSAMPYIMLTMFGMVLIMVFPKIVTWLPHLM